MGNSKRKNNFYIYVGITELIFLLFDPGGQFSRSSEETKFP
jgi:hypothetical protein